MPTVHHVNAVLVVSACLVAGILALLARRRGAGRGVTHAISLAQTLVIGQLLFGLILLAQHHRAHDRLHYAYGTFAVLAVFAPFLYAPADPRGRLLWFAIALLLAAALGVRAYMTAT
jgi:Na+-transporting NADH:ubiquinone oxidoreductase subunit NqrB